MFGMQKDEQDQDGCAAPQGKGKAGKGTKHANVNHVRTEEETDRHGCYCASLPLALGRRRKYTHTITPELLGPPHHPCTCRLQ
jgi:hypothetical protein